MAFLPHILDSKAAGREAYLQARPCAVLRCDTSCCAALLQQSVRPARAHPWRSCIHCLWHTSQGMLRTAAMHAAVVLTLS